MDNLTDQQLLRDYTGRRSEPAFAELVRRHVDLVYSAALRMVRDPHLAQDVTQAVFVALAQNARQLADRAILSGWLHRTAQNLAANAVRSTVRRRAREQEAAAMNELLAHESDAPWEHLAPHLDAALGELAEPDRDAILLRYFERKSAREMAETLGVSEDAAQKRVTRAVERLREFFTKRGVTVGAGGLVAVISANAVQAAPSGLAAVISATGATAAAITITKAGAVVKSSATVGSLGGSLAMLGGAYISMRARADDTKSPRERNFILRMVGVRVVAMVITMAAFIGVAKLDLFHEPLAHEILTATLLYVASVIGTVFFICSSRRQRQIQLEEGTYEEAEWKLPRKKTGAIASRSVGKSNAGTPFKAVRFMTLGLVMFAVMVAQAPWKEHLGQALLLLAGLALTLWLSYRSWQNRPRYLSLRSGWVVGMPAILGLMTLIAFNVHQHRLQSGPAVSSVVSPEVVLVFNLGVVSAYAVFVGILALIRKKEFRSLPSSRA